MESPKAVPFREPLTDSLPAEAQQASPGSVASIWNQQHLRRIVAALSNFAGRTVGIVVSAFVVARMGVGASSAQVLLAIALSGYAVAAFGSLVELHTISLLGRKERCRRGDLVITGLAVGVGTSLVALGVLGLVAGVIPTVRPILWLSMPLLLSASVAIGSNSYLGFASFEAQWSRGAIPSGIRAAVVIVVLPLLPAAHLGIAVVATLAVAEVARYVAFALLWPTSWRGSRLDRRLTGLVFRQAPSTLLSSANPTLDRLLLYFLSLGSVAILDLAARTYGVGVLLFTQGALPLLYRRWARMGSIAAAQSVFGVAKRTFLVTAAAVPLGSAIVILGAHAAVAGTEDLRYELSITTVALLAGLPAYLTGQVVVRLYVLHGAVRVLNAVALLQLVLNAALDLVLGRAIGVAGIAAATAVTVSVSAAITYIDARRRYGLV